MLYANDTEKTILYITVKMIRKRLQIYYMRKLYRKVYNILIMKMIVNLLQIYK